MRIKRGGWAAIAHPFPTLSFTRCASMSLLIRIDWAVRNGMDPSVFLQTPLVPLRMCATLPAILSTSPTLYVHSVFRHACNLRTPAGTLVALLDAHLQLAPASIVIDCGDFTRLLRPGETLHTCRSAGQYRGGSLWLDLRLTPTGSCAVADLSPTTTVCALCRAVGTFLPLSPPSDGIWLMLPPTGKEPRFLAIIAALSRWWRDSGAPADAFPFGLIGAGAGLTPSGDDFLLGCLFVLALYRRPQFARLCDAIDGHLHKTTDISRAMLAHGCAGRFSHALLSLARADRPDALAFALRQAADHGHSSGHDMLTGMYFAIQQEAARSGVIGTPECVQPNGRKNCSCISH